jgi:recombination protein RecT
MTDTSTAVATKPPIIVLRERLESRKPELAAALTDISPDQFIRALVTSAQINPELQACSWQSLWLACMRACRDQLLPDGREGAIVPFKSTATWIPMYQGLLKRFRQSGQFKWITAGIVRTGERFEHYIDEAGEHFLHVPGDLFDAPMEKIYAMATTKDGGFFVTVMPLAEANKIKAMSRASREDAPWKMWPEEMYKKTALRRLSKLLPAGRDFVDDEPGNIEDAEQGPLLQAAPTLQPIAGPGPLPPRTAAEALDRFASTDATTGDEARAPENRADVKTGK